MANPEAAGGPPASRPCTRSCSLPPPLDIATNLFLAGEFISQPAVAVDRLARQEADVQAGRRDTEQAAHQRAVDPRRRRQPVRAASASRSPSDGRRPGPGGTSCRMDEPIAALGVRQSEFALELIHTLADRGVAVVLISHNMQQVLEVRHEVVVLRHGRNVGKFPIGDVVVR